MTIYFFLRYALIPFALIGWIFYQLEVNKKPWKEVQGDAIAILCFVALGSGIFYWLFF